ncbi:MAG: TerB N-terminal domain-containing protein [Oscillospiraceae bacterium]|nr:TerB N-terminal domain-containing protein [Oscillospiraceae bacterium]
MRLSDLAAYAEEKYHIGEQHKWNEFPGFSVLAEPTGGKWAALLMHRWDPELGEETERCDIRCGRAVLGELSEPYLSEPYRMHGDGWIGVRFDSGTDPDTVYMLFDRAVRESSRGAASISRGMGTGAGKYRDTPIPSGPDRVSEAPVPSRIREMMKLYTYSDGSFAEKCRNFYIQGKFMEDYEDDAPFGGSLIRYYTTYHDLSVRQLRGYMSWRTAVRKGRFEPISTSLAYMYLYELLNGIGADSPEDSLKKMREFEKGYIDSGTGEADMRKNLRRWMLEFGVINGVEREKLTEYTDGGMTETDEALAVLRACEGRGDGEIFDALCVFGGNRLRSSAVIKKRGDEGRRLFASVWRTAERGGKAPGRNLFTACFGRQHSARWHPLENAVYWNRRTPEDTEYVLNECRRFICRGGKWTEMSYRRVNFNKTVFDSFIRETDRRLRLYLKTGSPLKERSADAWADGIIDAAIEEDRRAKLEAKRKKTVIRYDELDRIRRDAAYTRESLLTEEETEPEENAVSAPLSGAAAPEEPESVCGAALSERQILVLSALLRNEPVSGMLRSWNEMAEVFADALNEALFDELGDTAVECGGEEITIVEDYREDIIRILSLDGRVF